MMSTRLFEDSDHAKIYATGRPGYPNDLVNFVIDHVSQSTGSCDLCIDVGCGSGQNTSLYANFFKKVIATDISESQIKQAKELSNYENVEYVCTPAEVIPASDSSVDLITCASAIHWFDQEAFFKAAERVLKPGGCLAIYFYSPPFIYATKELNDLFEEEFWKKVTPYQSSRVLELRKHGLSNIELPFPFRLQRRDFTMNIRQPLEVTLSFYESFSFYRTYRMNHPEDDILGKLMQRCKEYADKQGGSRDDYFQYTLRYDFLLTKKPGGHLSYTS